MKAASSSASAPDTPLPRTTTSASIDLRAGRRVTRDCIEAEQDSIPERAADHTKDRSGTKETAVLVKELYVGPLATSPVALHCVPHARTVHAIPEVGVFDKLPPEPVLSQGQVKVPVFKTAPDSDIVVITPHDL